MKHTVNDKFYLFFFTFFIHHVKGALNGSNFANDKLDYIIAQGIEWAGELVVENPRFQVRVVTA